METDIRKAFQAFVEVKREMKPLFKSPVDETDAKKQDRKQKLLKYKGILMAKKSVMVAEAQKAYKAFCCFFVGDLRTQRDKIVHKMYTKGPWIGVNGNSCMGPCIDFWLSF
jgi:hypothetical protein